MKIGFGFLSVFFLVALVSGSGLDQIVYMTEDYPPSNYLENGELKGVAVEVLKVVWRKLGVKEMPIKVYPWARGYSLAQTQPNHMLFAMSRSEEREKMFKWAGPIYRGRYSLLALSEKTISIKNLNEAKKYRIGVMRDDFGEKVLVNSGFLYQRLFVVTSIEQMVQMLRAGRIDLICIYEDSLKEYTLRSRLNPSFFKTIWVVKENLMYFAFSLGTDDQIIRIFQNALRSIDKERIAIVKKYRSMP